MLYHDILERVESDRILYLAVRDAVFTDVFQDPIGQVLLENQRVRLVVFDAQAEVIVRWIP